jgi:hypothetical protein
MVDLHQLEEGAARRAAAIAVAAERARSLRAAPPPRAPRAPLAAWLARFSYTPHGVVGRLARAVGLRATAQPAYCPA